MKLTNFPLPTAHCPLAILGVLACVFAHAEPPGASPWKNRVASLDRDLSQPRYDKLLENNPPPTPGSPAFREPAPESEPRKEKDKSLPWRAPGSGPASVAATSTPPAHAVVEPPTYPAPVPPLTAPLPPSLSPPIAPDAITVITPPPVPPPPQNPTRSALPSPDPRAIVPRVPKHISDELATKLRKPGDLILHNTALRDALLQIGLAWNVNIVFGAEVNGSAYGTFTKTPLHEILRTILTPNGYGYKAVGDSLAILKTEHLGDLDPLFETAVLVLHAASPADVTKSAALFLSPHGKVEAVESARTIVVVDLPERIDLIRRFVEQVDEFAARKRIVAENSPRIRRVLHVQLHYIDAKPLEDAIKALLTKSDAKDGLEDGKVATIVGENRLVVMDYPHILSMVDQCVRAWDVPRPQVRITALIYDVSLDYLQRMGINWKAGARGFGTGPLGGSGSGSSSFPLLNVESAVQTAVSGAPGTVTLMNLSKDIDLGAIINCLKQDSDSRLLADPSVLVTNRNKANIGIFTEIPYQQLTQTVQGGNIGTTEFKQAGVKLDVTPYISLDGTLELDVEPEFSRLVGYYSGSSPQPIIDTRKAKTRVRVVDRQTIVIGGLRQRNDVSTIAGVPKLRDVKGLGKFFRSREEITKESELVVFITPEIVTPLYQGRPREAGAFQAGQSLLDHVPMGFDPFTGPLMVHEPVEHVIPGAAPTPLQTPAAVPRDLPVPPAPPPSFDNGRQAPPPPRPAEDLPPLPADYSGSGLIRPSNRQTAGSFRVAQRQPAPMGLGTPPAPPPVEKRPVAPNSSGTRIAQRIFQRPSFLKPAPKPVSSQFERLPPVNAEPAANSATRTARPADDPGIRQATRPTTENPPRTSARWLDGIFRR